MLRSVTGGGLVEGETRLRRGPGPGWRPELTKAWWYCRGCSRTQVFSCAWLSWAGTETPLTPTEAGCGVPAKLVIRHTMAKATATSGRTIARPAGIRAR